MESREKGGGTGKVGSRMEEGSFRVGDGGEEDAEKSSRGIADAEGSRAKRRGERNNRGRRTDDYEDAKCRIRRDASWIPRSRNRTRRRHTITGDPLHEPRDSPSTRVFHDSFAMRLYGTLRTVLMC